MADTENLIPTRPPTQIVYLNRPLRPRVSYAVKYTGHNISAVKWVSGFQMLLAVSCVILQIIALIFYDNWTTIKSKFSNHFEEYEYGYAYVELDSADVLGTGIWGGIMMIITAAIGISSWRQNRKGLVIAYLVLSVITIPISLTLLGTSASSLDSIRRCRLHGTYTSVSNNRYEYRYQYRYWHGRETTDKPERIYFFGEDLGYESHANRFYCQDATFQVWMAVDAVMVISSSMMFILLMVSLVYSSKAACGGCCCSCCLPQEEMATPIQSPVWTNHPTLQQVYVEATSSQPPVTGEDHPNSNNGEETKGSPPPAYSTHDG